MRMHVNEIEAMYERPRVNSKVERGPTFTFKRDIKYIVSILFKSAYNFRLHIFLTTFLEIAVQSTPDNSNLQGKSEKVRVTGSSKQVTENKK